MKSSHAEALKAKAAFDTAEALRKIEERLAKIEAMLDTPVKKGKKEGEQAATSQPDKS